MHKQKEQIWVLEQETKGGIQSVYRYGHTLILCMYKNLAFALLVTFKLNLAESGR